MVKVNNRIIHIRKYCSCKIVQFQFLWDALSLPRDKGHCSDSWLFASKHFAQRRPYSRELRRRSPRYRLSSRYNKGIKEQRGAIITK